MLKLITDLVGVAIEIGLLRYIYKAFFPKCRVSERQEWLVYFASAVIAFVISYLEITTQQRMFYTFCIDIALAFLYLEKWIVKIFVGALFFAVQISCEFFAWSFLALVSGNIAEALDGHSITNYVQGVFLSKSLAGAILYVIAGLSKHNEYHGKKLLLCTYMLFPLVTTLCLNQVASATELLQNEEAHISFLLIAFFMIGANIAIFYLFDKQMQAEKERWEYQMMALRERMQGEYYNALINRDLEVSKLYHDMKNHIAFLKYRADEEDLTGVQAYLETLSDAFVVEKVHFTNQSTINAILNMKSEQAREKQAALDIMVPKIFPLVKITDMDLVIVLANCLDNAIEAVEKLEQAELRKIRVVILNDEGGISILVENPVSGEVNVNALRTTKADKENHGLGLKNIKSIVQKYEGNFQIEIENQIFRVKIYLPN